MYRVFLTGGIASGKSTVAKLLEQRGAMRLDLDALSREVLAPGSPVLVQVAERFGSDVILPDGQLNRSLLAERVFSDERALLALEAIEHPAILQALSKAIQEAGAQLVVVEVPLLNKVGESLQLADEVVAVLSPLGLRRERALARGVSEADFERRLACQPSDDYLRENSDTVILNDAGLVELQHRVDLWLQQHEDNGWNPLRGGEARG